MTNREAAIKIVTRLRKAGFESLFAGGCVRDLLLGRIAKDYDVATSAHPADVIKLFHRTINIGAKFGVVMVMTGKIQTEVATFRTESGYADGRHPGKVEFADATEDAARRDFTVNGMFYDPIEKKVIDYVRGRDDLKRKLLRTIGQPDKRFSEDYLRMLRAIRFAAQLGFKIEKKTFHAVCDNASKISCISGERIAAELEATLACPARAEGASKLIESGLARAIFLKLDTEKIKLGVSVLACLRKRVDFPLAMAAFFAHCQSGHVLDGLNPLKLSKNRTRHITFLLQNRGVLLDGDMALSALKLLLSEPYFPDLYELQRAVQRATGETISPLVKIERRAKVLKGQALRPKPLLNGHELIALGATSGPQVGQLAEELYIAQLEGDIKTAAEARRWSKCWLEDKRILR